MTKSRTKILGIGVLAIISSLLAVPVALRQPNWSSLAYPIGIHADATVLKSHVRFLASSDNPRSARNPAGLSRAAKYISHAFSLSGARCSEQPYPAGGRVMKNIIAVFGPQTGERIIVGAHYDVFGNLPGADDNASGVAGLLELSRLVGSLKLRHPVELVAFSTEEPPFFGSEEMGSAFHARSLRKSRASVRAMICLEMIGFFAPSQSGSSELLRLLYPRTGNFVALVGRWPDRDLVRTAKKCFRGATIVPAVSYSGPLIQDVDLSDQRNYWAPGYHAFMVTDTAFLRNPNYHTSRDTPETLDYQRMAGIVDGVLSTIAHLAK